MLCLTIIVLLICAQCYHQQQDVKSVDLICQLKEDIQNAQSAIDGSNAEIQLQSPYLNQISNQQQPINPNLQFSIPISTNQLNMLSQQHNPSVEFTLNEQGSATSNVNQGIQIPLSMLPNDDSNDYEFIASIQNVDQDNEETNIPVNYENKPSQKFNSMYQMPMSMSDMQEIPYQSQISKQTYFPTNQNLHNHAIFQQPHQQSNKFSDINYNQQTQKIDGTLDYIKSCMTSFENILNKLYQSSLQNANIISQQQNQQQNQFSNFAGQMIDQPAGSLNQEVISHYPQCGFSIQPEWNKHQNQQEFINFAGHSNGQATMPFNQDVNPQIGYVVESETDIGSGNFAICPSALPPDNFEEKLKADQNQYFKEFQIPLNWKKFACMKEACLKQTGNKHKGYQIGMGSGKSKYGPARQGHRGQICN